MAYVQGFVVAVPAGNKDRYLRQAERVAPVFRELGATRVVEAWGDDVPEGRTTDYRRAVKAEQGEVVVFCWVEYPSRQVRDAANEKMLADPRMEELAALTAFDAKRMIHGGFSLILDDGPAAPVGYVDGALLPVPAAAKEAYLQAERAIVAVLKEHGAARVVEAWEDDVPRGEVTDYQGAVQAGGDEKVVFSWIEWPSKAVRDEGWRKIAADPRMYGQRPPYDHGRRVHGGFRPILEA